MGLNEIKLNLSETVAAIQGTVATEATFAQPQLYEEWLRKDTWRLAEEALPLLCGVAPTAWQGEAFKARAASLWRITKQAFAAGGGPAIANPEAPEEEWCVRPADLYRWARTQAVVLPTAFDELMGFVLRVVKIPEPSADSPTFITQVPVSGTSTAREHVLGAALNVLAKCPEQCYDQHGLVSGERIAERIRAQSLRWFDSADPPMDPGSMAVLIDRWLE